MSEPATALNAARFEGAATVEELPRRGMITLRGDLASDAMRAAVTGAGLPGLPEVRRIVSAGDRSLAWMSPDELLLMLPPEAVPAALEGLADALSGRHHMAVEVTDARALFAIRGPGGSAREVLAKLAPVDMSVTAFTPGTFRRTRLAQVPAAFWLREDGVFELMCFRSVAAYVFGLLSVGAEAGGEVGFF